jgi:hypothetical protein
MELMDPARNGWNWRTAHTRRKLISERKVRHGCRCKFPHDRVPRVFLDVSDTAGQNILEWETVLANGTIVTIKASERPELARAMRGGGGEFGIVTKFTLRTYPMTNAWGGLRAYAAADRAAVFAGLADFVENNHKDPNAAVIFTSGMGSVSVMFVYLGGGTPPPENAFGKLGKIKASMDTCKTATYESLITMSDAMFPFMSMRTSFRSITLPHLPKDHGYYERIDSMWNNITAKRASMFAQSTLAFQPFNHAVGKATEERGGNSMGLRGTDGDRFVIEIAGVYMRQADDKLMLDMAREFTDKLEVEVKTMAEKARAAGGQKSFETYLPHFMNDAAADQDVTGTYREHKLFAQLQKEMDPTGFFAKRAGGFKYQRTT